MDFDKLLSDENSPFIIPASEELLSRILRDIIQGNQYPQDALANVLIEKSFSELPQIYIELLNQKYNITPQEFALIMKGYSTALLAVNIAVRSRSEGEYPTFEYLMGFDNSYGVKDYLGEHLHDLKVSVIKDYTCSDLFTYIEINPPDENEFLVFGIRFAKLRFGSYGAIIIYLMQREMTVLQLFKIWSGQA